MLLDFAKYSIPELLSKINSDPLLEENRKMELLSLLKEWDGSANSFMVLSSGTTGKKKEMIFSRSSLMRSAEITIKTFDLNESSVLLHSLPFEFIAGKMMLIRAIVSKAKIHILEANLSPLKNLNTSIDFAAFTPHQLDRILAEEANKLDLIKVAIIGGSKLELDLEKKLYECKNHFYETFGMSETLTHFAIRKVDKDERDGAFKILEGFSLDHREDGLLSIHADHLGEGSIITNDKIEFVAPDRFNWLGRADNMINSGGINLFPEELERRLLDKIQGNFLIGKKKDSSLGEKMVIFIEKGPKNKEIKLRDIDFEGFKNYEIPKELILIDKIPRNENGKVLRRELNERT